MGVVSLVSWGGQGVKDDTLTTENFVPISVSGDIRENKDCIKEV